MYTVIHILYIYGITHSNISALAMVMPSTVVPTNA